MTLVDIPASCQVFTPRCLANSIIESLPDNNGARWLEPSAGRGVFLTSLNSKRVSKSRIKAIELDPTPAAADKFANTVRGMDFLEWAISTTERFDHIIGNPPYLPIRDLPPRLARNAMLIRDPEGNCVTYGANLWYAFICASLGLLRDGGSIAFVLPASSIFAGYGIPLRQQLTSLFQQTEVHRSQEPLFEEVRDGTVVFIGRGFRQQGGRFRAWIYRDLKELCAGIVNNRNKHGRRCPNNTISCDSGHVLGDIIDVRLGGVTGDSKYFLMTEDQRLERLIPEEACQPVLTRAKQLTNGIMSLNEWRRMRDTGERIWLFRPSASMTRRQSVKKYMDLHVKSGGCDKSSYKISRRSPWYITPLPERVDGFISGMASAGPWLCLRKMRGLSATNTLYTFSFLDRYSLAEKVGFALALMTPEVRRQLNRIGRVYAGGLVKFEPNEIRTLRIPDPIITDNPEVAYNQVIEILLSKGRKAAEHCVAGFRNASALTMYA